MSVPLTMYHDNTTLYQYEDNTVIVVVRSFWCLTLHSVIFHWYHGGQFIGGREHSTKKATSSFHATFITWNYMLAAVQWPHFTTKLQTIHSSMTARGNDAILARNISGIVTDVNVTNIPLWLQYLVLILEDSVC